MVKPQAMVFAFCVVFNIARGFNHGRCVLKGQFGKRNHRNGYCLRPAVDTAGYFTLCVVFQYSSRL